MPGVGCPETKEGRQRDNSSLSQPRYLSLSHTLALASQRYQQASNVLANLVPADAHAVKHWYKIVVRMSEMNKICHPRNEVFVHCPSKSLFKIYRSTHNHHTNSDVSSFLNHALSLSLSLSLQSLRLREARWTELIVVSPGFYKVPFYNLSLIHIQMCIRDRQQCVWMGGCSGEQ